MSSHPPTPPSPSSSSSSRAFVRSVLGRHASPNKYNETSNRPASCGPFTPQPPSSPPSGSSSRGRMISPAVAASPETPESPITPAPPVINNRPQYQLRGRLLITNEASPVTRPKPQQFEARLSPGAFDENLLPLPPILAKLSAKPAATPAFEVELRNCAICLDVVKKNECITCTRCTTVAHPQCLQKWFAIAAKRPEDIEDYGTCPGCREPLNWTSSVMELRNHRAPLRPLNRSPSPVCPAPPSGGASIHVNQEPTVRSASVSKIGAGFRNFFRKSRAPTPTNVRPAEESTFHGVF